MKQRSVCWRDLHKDNSSMRSSASHSTIRNLYSEAGHWKAYKSDILDRPHSRPKLSVEKVAERDVVRKVRVVHLVQIAAKHPGVELVAGLSRPDGKLFD
jgi:hypothetical protein